MFALPSIDYATPTKALPPTESQFERAIRCWAVAAGVAVFLLLAFAITKWSPILFAGFLWLGAGGLLSLIALVFGIHFRRRAAAADYPSPHTRRRAALAALLPASNVPLAFACVCFGAMLASAVQWRTTITIDNPLPVAVDNVTVVMADASRHSLGRIDAHGSRRATLAVPKDGDVRIDVLRDDHAWRQHVASYIDDDDLPRDERVTLVEPSQ